MARNIGNIIQNHFKAGLITEATGLNYPPNAAIATENCIFTIKESIQRRFGFSEGSTDTIIVPPAPPPPTGLILDNITAQAAYSMRLLRTAYTGPIIQVGRHGDSATQDWYATNNGWVDFNAIAVWCEAAGFGGQGWITRFYDQTGNGFTLQATGLAGSAQIAVGGVPVTYIGPGFNVTETWTAGPFFPFMGGDQYFSVSFTGLSTTSSTIHAIATFQDEGTASSAASWEGSSPLIAFSNVDEYSLFLGYANSGTLFTCPAVIASRGTGNSSPNYDIYVTKAAAAGTPYSLLYTYNTAGSLPNEFYVNGGVPVTTTSTVANMASVTLDVGNSKTAAGGIAPAEIVLFPSALSVAQANQVGVDMYENYGIPWTTITE